MLIPGFQAGLQKAYEKVRVDPDKYMLPIAEGAPPARSPVGTTCSNSPATICGLTHSASSVPLRARQHSKARGSDSAALRLSRRIWAFSPRSPFACCKSSACSTAFEYATDNETVELWIAAASAAGLELGRDFLEKQTVQHLVPRVIDLIAVRLSEEVVEKWAGRLIPVISAGAGAALNYYFVRAWGRRAQKHFEARHRAVRRDEFTFEPPPISNALPGWTM